MKKLLSISFLLVLTFSGSSFAHSGHSHPQGGWWGAAGAAFNAVEAVKHGLVIYDQFTGPSEERNYPVLVSNVAMFLAHMIWVHHHVQDEHQQRPAITIPLFLAANALTLVDMFVDGVTSWEYWAKKSLVASVVNLFTPVCTAHNVMDLFFNWRATRKA